MPYGKHQGTFVDELPPGYVNWMLINAYDGDGKDTLPFVLRRALEQALRDGTGQTVALRRLILRWWEEVRAEYDPENGGSEETWAALQHAQELLRTQAGLDRKSRRQRMRP